MSGSRDSHGLSVLLQNNEGEDGAKDAVRWSLFSAHVVRGGLSKAQYSPPVIACLGTCKGQRGGEP